MKPIKIITDRLVLQPLRQQDAETFFNYRSQPDVFLFQEWQPQDVADASEFISAFAAKDPMDRQKWNQLGIYLSLNQKLIGDCGFKFEKVIKVQVGFTISPVFQRQGYGFEAVEGLLKYLIRSFDLQSIIAHSDPENFRSILLLQKLGFRQVKHLKKGIRIRGQWKDDLIFDLTVKGTRTGTR